jgi:ATP-dependent HslUV protease ATP-binding subunit HslU
VEATKFTEVGYVGRDVEQIIRDLVEASIAMVRDKRRATSAPGRGRRRGAHPRRPGGPGLRPRHPRRFRKRLRAGELDDKEVEITVADTAAAAGLRHPGQQGGIGMINLSDVLGKALGGRTKTQRMTVKEAHKPLVAEESEKLLDQEALTKEALDLAENQGIVFLDEIDKVASRAERGGADVSREGVQRDLLPLIEGTTVSTKYGPVKTDHVLFIASGAFHVAKPSDLLPELQGRLPIRVELKPLTREDFRRILTEPEANLIRQTRRCCDRGGHPRLHRGRIDALADAAVAVNGSVENIGARRLQTVLEKVVEDVSFRAADLHGQTITVDADYVATHVGDLAKDADLSRFIL